MTTAKELWEEFKRADDDMSQSFDNEFWSGQPPLEAQLSFLNTRLRNTIRLAYQLTAVIDGKATSNHPAEDQ